MHNKDHWENVYSTKAEDSVSWFQAHADTSMQLIHASGLGKDAAIMDVGRLTDVYDAFGSKPVSHCDMSAVQVLI